MLDEYQREEALNHYRRGLVLERANRLDEAVEEYRQAIGHYPEDWEVYNLLGSCQLRLGAYDEALATFNSALRLAPQPLAQAEVIERICTVERYREIGSSPCAKDQLYAEHGVVYLGSTQD